MITPRTMLFIYDAPLLKDTTLEESFDIRAQENTCVCVVGRYCCVQSTA